MLDCTRESTAFAAGPDGLIDSHVFDPFGGIIFFPDTQPFDPGLEDIAEGFPGPECRPRALGWRLVGDRYEPVSPSERSESDARYVITGTFQRIEIASPDRP